MKQTHPIYAKRAGTITPQPAKLTGVCKSHVSSISSNARVPKSILDSYDA